MSDSTRNKQPKKLFVTFFTYPHSLRKEKFDYTKAHMRIIQLEDYVERWKDLIDKHELWIDGKYDPVLFHSRNYSKHSSFNIGEIETWCPLHIEWEYNRIYDNEEFNEALKSSREHFNST